MAWPPPASFLTPVYDMVRLISPKLNRVRGTRSHEIFAMNSTGLDHQARDLEIASRIGKDSLRMIARDYELSHEKVRLIGLDFGVTSDLVNQIRRQPSRKKGER